MKSDESQPLFGLSEDRSGIHASQEASLSCRIFVLETSRRRLVRYYWYPAMIIHANPQKTLAIAIRDDLDDFA